VVEQDDGRGEGDGHKRDDQVLQLGKEEREKQKTKEIKAKVSNGFLFWHSRHHRGCECV
jgi:hypothetical protein